MDSSSPPSDPRQFIGQPVWELPTPALWVDLNVLESNLANLNKAVGDVGIRWRADVAGHMCPELAKRCLAAGSTGVSLATVDHAETFLSAGIQDIVIRQPIVGADRLRQLLPLLRRGQITLNCDHFAQAQPLSDLLIANNLTCPIRVEVNLGSNQSGVRAGWDALDLVKGVASLPGLKVTGIWGSLDSCQANPEEPPYLSHGISLLSDLRDRMREHRGMTCELSWQGPLQGLTSWLLADEPDSEGTETEPLEPCPLTEIQLSDEALGFAIPVPKLLDFRISAVLLTSTGAASHELASVISRPKLDRAVLDVGSRHLGHSHFETAVVKNSRGRMLGLNQVADVALDHTTLNLSGLEGYDLLIGDKVVVDFVQPREAWLRQSQVFVVRENEVCDVWEIMR